MAMLNDFLYTHTGGQPLFLLETLKLLRDRQGLVPRRRPDGTWKLVLDKERITTLTQERSRSELIPTSLRTLIMAHLARLSPSARQLALVSAVLGTGTSAQRLWQIAELEEQAGIEALEEAIGSGFLCEEEGWEDASAGYRCTYGLVREVLYTELGAVRRRIIQQRALVLLHRERGTAVRLPKSTKASR
jgi:predicted ATPase